jgi:hypothetical protein
MNQNDSLNKESLERVREIQLCIITTNSKELDNIRQNFRMAQWEHVLVSFDPSSANVQNIYISSFTLGIGTPFPFYITSCSGQDVLSFAVEATSLLIHLKPKFAIFTGEIAAAGTVTLKGIESYNDA